MVSSVTVIRILSYAQSRRYELRQRVPKPSVTTLSVATIYGLRPYNSIEGKTDTMTPRVVNEDDAESVERSHGEKFASRDIELGLTTGSEKLGCTLYEVPPEHSAVPYHYHTANEEALYVLTGTGTLRTKSGEVEISKGDYATFLAGDVGAHQVTNTSDETLRYLCFSTMQDPEVLVYPDSDKIGVRGEAPGAPNKNLREDAELDYWEGETS